MSAIETPVVSTVAVTSIASSTNTSNSMTSTLDNIARGIRGRFAPELANEIMNFKFPRDRAVKVIVVIGLAKKVDLASVCKVFAVEHRLFWDAMSEAVRNIRRFGNEPSTLAVYGPMVNSDDVIAAIRRNHKFTKLTGIDGKKREFTLASANDIGSKHEYTVKSPSGIHSTTPVSLNLKAAAVNQLLAKRKTKKAVKQEVAQTTTNVTSQFNTLLNQMFPAPKVAAPAMTTRALIKARVLAFAAVNSPTPMNISADEIHSAWRLLWQQYDIRTGSNYVANYTKLCNATTYSGSILDMAALDNVLEEVYALACEVLVKDTVLPRIFSVTSDLVNVSSTPTSIADMVKAKSIPTDTIIPDVLNVESIIEIE